MVNSERYNGSLNFTKSGVSKIVQQITSVLILLFLVCIASNTRAGEFSGSGEPDDETVIVECCDYGKGMTVEAIRFHGPIRHGDSKKVLEIIEKYRNKHFFFIYLDSIGGDIREAMIIGRLVSRFHLITFVEEGDKCFSACLAIFVAGDRRWPFGTMGIHRPRFKAQYFANLELGEAKKKYNEMLEEYANYLRSFHVTESMIEDMITTPSSDIKTLSWRDVKRYKLRDPNPGFREWLRAKCGGLSQKEDDILTAYRGGPGLFYDLVPFKQSTADRKKQEAARRKYSLDYIEHLKAKKNEFQHCRGSAIKAEQRKAMNKYFGQ